MLCNLYERDSYKNPNIIAIFGMHIYEYDIKSAGYNITRQFNLLPKEDIDRLTDMNKKKRHIAIGLYMRKDSEYKKKLKQGFIDARKFLFNKNNLKEEDVITIKKDAVFTLVKCDNTDMGYIHFRNKNEYTSYIRLGYLEIFYNSKIDKFDIKGIDDESVKKHNDGILLFLKQYIISMENKDDKCLFKLMRFINHYKNYELSSSYYRTFDVNSCFVEINDSSLMLDYIMDDYDDSEIENLDISYNYLNILVPLVELTMKINSSN